MCTCESNKQINVKTNQAKINPAPFASRAARILSSSLLTSTCNTILSLHRVYTCWVRLVVELDFSL